MSLPHHAMHGRRVINPPLPVPAKPGRAMPNHATPRHALPCLAAMSLPLHAAPYPTQPFRTQPSLALPGRYFRTFTAVGSNLPYVPDFCGAPVAQPNPPPRHVEPRRQLLLVN